MIRTIICLVKGHTYKKEGLYEESSKVGDYDVSILYQKLFCPRCGNNDRKVIAQTSHFRGS